MQVQTNQNLYMICIGIVLFYTLTGWLVPLGVKIGYGRLKNSFSKIQMPARIAWFLFQVPNLLWAFYFIILKKESLSVGFGLFILHYINRDIIYPLRLNTTNKVPMQIILGAMTFTFANGYLQGISNRILSQETNSFSALTIIRVFGIVIFFIGAFINIKSDQILKKAKQNSIKAKKEQQSTAKAKHGYVVVNDFLFKYIANPNYFGQIIEWFGYFLVCLNLQSFMFFFSTLNILTAASIPRSKWNKQNIEGYPKNRKAIFPYIL